MTKNKKKEATKPTAAPTNRLRDIVTYIKNDTARFMTGVVCAIVAAYMMLAFSSFFTTGAADQSILERPQAGELLSVHNHIQNFAGALGAQIAEFFINGCFGIPSFFIALFLAVAGLKLIKAYNVRLWKWFFCCSFLLVWCSIFMGFAVEPLMEDSFFYPGGAHGHNVSLWLCSQIGAPGLTLLLLATGILFCAILSAKTITFIRKVLHPNIHLKRKTKAAETGVDGEESAVAEDSEADGSSADGSGRDGSEAGDFGADGSGMSVSGTGIAGTDDSKPGMTEPEFQIAAAEANDNEPRPLTVDLTGGTAGGTTIGNTAGGAMNVTMSGTTAGSTTYSEEGLQEIVGPKNYGQTAGGEEPHESSAGNGSQGYDLGSGSGYGSGHGSQSNGSQGNGSQETAGNSAEGQHGMSGNGAGGVNPATDPSTEPLNVKVGGTAEDADVIPTEPYNPKLDLENYHYPTLDLLKKYENNTPSIDMDEQTANKNRIIEVLRSFNVEISSIMATVGPTITLYEITPAQGVRIAKIRNLENDIALCLAAEGIRIIAPIPGKSTIGIEVPNARKMVVPMWDVLASKKFQESTYELPMALGKTITNEVYMADLAKAPHLLVAGATGQGKSVALNAIVTSLLYKKHPAELKFVIIDPKKVEFAIYAPIERNFLAKLEDEEDAIITDVKKVVKTLNSLCKEMDTRYMLLKDAGCRNIKEYNEKFKDRKLNPNNGHHFMPYIVVIIDEFGDLIMTAGKEVEFPIVRIAQLARAVGIHAIIATQRPTTNIITGSIKANFPARMALKVSSMIDSRTILDRSGAQQLIGRGDMLYLQGSDTVRVQCAFVDTPEVERIANYINHQQSYPHAFILPEPDMPDEEGGSGGAADVDLNHLDPMFEDAARLIVINQQGSTSLIQRKFSIGYNRAGRLMDQLEKAGIVGPTQGSKPREVLCISEDDLEARLQNLKEFNH